MPILPLDHPEPLAATLGVMLYPGIDEESQKKARAFAAQFLAEPLRQFHAAGGVLAYEDLARIASDSGVPLDDLQDRWRDGTATGEIFKGLFALANTDPSLASWGNATKLVGKIVTNHEMSGSRSSLYTSRSLCISVAHLWGAWCIRGRRIDSDPAVGYEAWHDLQYFLAESEILRRWGQSWRSPRPRSEPPLPVDVWRMPQGWAPPEHRAGWPLTGRVPVVTMPADQLIHLQKPDRPKKKGKEK